MPVRRTWRAGRCARRGVGPARAAPRPPSIQAEASFRGIRPIEIKTVAVFRKVFHAEARRRKEEDLGKVKVSPDDKSSLFSVKMLMRIISRLGAFACPCSFMKPNQHYGYNII